MSINYKKPSQFELFPGTSSKSNGTPEKRSLFKDLTIPIENIIVLCIILIMSWVFFFSMGVEKGKRFAQRGSEREQAGVVFKTEPKASSSIGKESLKENDQGKSEASRISVEKTSGQQNSVQEKQPLEHSPVEQNIEKDAFTIQVASFKLERNARKEALKLKDLGYKIFVVPKGKYSIVCVGAFQEKQEALSFSEKLKVRYNDCLVRRL